MVPTGSAPVKTRWTGHGRDPFWNDAANWSAAPPGAVPGAGEVAVLDGVGLLIDLGSDGGGNPIDGQLAVLGGSATLEGGTLLCVRPPYDGRFFAGVGLRVDGTLDIDPGAALLGQHTVVLGDSAPATLDVLGQLYDAQVYAGRLGSVSVNVIGPGARWVTGGIDQSFQFGGAATSMLLVVDGGYVGDGHAWTVADASSTMTIGGSTAGASVEVSEVGSQLRFQIIDVGGSYSGTLEIYDGGRVTDLGGNVGQSGDGMVYLAGRGAVWDNVNGLFVGGAVPHGLVSVADHGCVSFGSYGLQDSGTVLLDPTAQLVGGTIVLAGGALSGEVPVPGVTASVVTVSQAIELGYNPALSGSNAGNFVGSAAGITLALAGVVTAQGAGSDPLAVGGGWVVLDNPDNGDFAIALHGGVLEVAQAGASGGGPIGFLDSGGATLQLDQTGVLANPISGFATTSPSDIIDLQAVVFAAMPVASWQPNQPGGPLGGSLLVSDGTHAVSLTLDGGYAASGFHLSADAHGGTAVSYA